MHGRNSQHNLYRPAKAMNQLELYFVQCKLFIIGILVQIPQAASLCHL